MHKALIAYTEELDDVDAAVNELLGRLDTSKLLSDSVGLVYCDPGFHFSGVYEALCQKLDFPVLGATTITAAVATSRVSQILALMVITSDELKFSAVATERLKSGDNSVVERAYREAKERRGGEPTLIMTFFPLVSEYDPDTMIEYLSSLAPGVPIYGTLSSSPALVSFNDAKVLFNGEAFDDRMSILLIYGDVKPRFFRGSFSEEKHLKDKGVITSSKNNRILTINDYPAKDYFLQMGLSEDEAGNLLFPELFPLIMDLNDGSLPYVRAMLTNLEDGSVILNSGVKRGATISVSNIDVSELQASVDKTLESMKAEKDYTFAVFHSCAARYFVAFSYDAEMEIKAIKKHLGGENKLPYIFCYSGGEICPFRNRDGSLTNRIHTYSFTCCVF
ncbi:MAG: FIST C-terminal domain-containing protein [Deltaproteobacteria bacterium]|jgi:hypothetical protein|nr:FIST C-terminal domain-containing protein [Deltaproteobacteria bacterium]